MIPFLGAATLIRWANILTLNSRMLKVFMEELKPATVVPVHFGTFEHYLEPIEEVVKLNDNKIHIMKPGEKKNLQSFM